MSTTYALRQTTAQKKDANTAASVVDASSQSESLQRKADLANNATQRAEAPRPNNTGMPDNLKSGIESLSGFSMDDVRVHYNSSKPATVQALAYTQGTDIHVAPGQEKHLPHEAWHVAQQMAGRVSPTTNINGMPVNDNAALEHEADVMGEKAVQCKGAKKGDFCPKGPLNEVFQMVRITVGDKEWEYCNYYKNLCDIILNGDIYVNITIGKETKKRKDWKKILKKEFGEAVGYETYGNFLISNCQSFDEVCNVCRINAPKQVNFYNEPKTPVKEKIQYYTITTCASDKKTTKWPMLKFFEEQITSKKLSKQAIDSGNKHTQLYKDDLQLICHNQDNFIKVYLDVDKGLSSNVRGYYKKDNLNLTFSHINKKEHLG